MYITILIGAPVAFAAMVFVSLQTTTRRARRRLWLARILRQRYG